MRWEPGHVGMQLEQFRYELNPQFYGIDVNLKKIVRQSV